MQGRFRAACPRTRIEHPRVQREGVQQDQRRRSAGRRPARPSSCPPGSPSRLCSDRPRCVATETRPARPRRRWRPGRPRPSPRTGVSRRGSRAPGIAASPANLLRPRPAADSRHAQAPTRPAVCRRPPRRRDRRRRRACSGGEISTAPVTSSAAAVLQRQLGAERPAEQPPIRQPARPPRSRPQPRTSSRSATPSSKTPSLRPCTLAVPLVLNRSTANPASAGSRNAALRYRWESIMPPWVGSGCRQIRVATGSLSSAAAPARRPAAGRLRCAGRSARRRAGSTVLARISVVTAAILPRSPDGMRRPPARVGLPGPPRSCLPSCTAGRSATRVTGVTRCSAEPRCSSPPSSERDRRRAGRAGGAARSAGQGGGCGPAGADHRGSGSRRPIRQPVRAAEIEPSSPSPLT